jgi:hypothetical protein
MYFWNEQANRPFVSSTLMQDEGRRERGRSTFRRPATLSFFDQKDWEYFGGSPCEEGEGKK